MDKIGSSQNLSSMTSISSTPAKLDEAQNAPRLSSPTAPARATSAIRAEQLENIDLSGKLGQAASTIMCPDW